jgi:hypothetical protein
VATNSAENSLEALNFKKVYPCPIVSEKAVLLFRSDSTITTRPVLAAREN